MRHVGLSGERSSGSPTGADEEHRGDERSDSGGSLAHGGGGGRGGVGSDVAGGGGGGATATGVVVAAAELSPALPLDVAGADAWRATLEEAAATFAVVGMCAATLVA